MTNYREILRLFGLGLNNSDIAAACGCSRTTVIGVLSQARQHQLTWTSASALPDKDLCRLLRPGEGGQVSYNLDSRHHITMIR